MLIISLTKILTMVVTQTSASTYVLVKGVYHRGAYNNSQMEGFNKGGKTRTTDFPPFRKNGLRSGSVSQTD